MMKKVLSVLLAMVMILSVAACGKKDVEFDAQGYVQAVLDAKYACAYDEYAKQVGVSKEEAEEQLTSEFAESLQLQLDAIGMIYTEEEAAEYVQLEADLRAKVKYEVKEAVKDEEGNYTVEVVVTPVDAYTSYGQQFTVELQNAVNEGATEEDYMSIFLKCFRDSVENAAVLDPVTVVLPVTFTESDNLRIYTIPEDDVLNFDLVSTGQTVS